MSYLLVFILGAAVGVFLEWKYGAAASSANASLHEKLDEIKAAVGK